LADKPVVSKSKKQKIVFIMKIVAEKLQKLNQEFSRENFPYLKIFLGNLLFGRDFWVA
jgi:hypothetical protein